MNSVFEQALLITAHHGVTSPRQLYCSDPTKHRSQEMIVSEYQIFPLTVSVSLITTGMQMEN